MKPFKPPGPEAMLTKSVRQLLTAAGIFHYKNFGGLGSPPGLPDITGCLKDGRGFWIELKAPRGVTSPAQQDFIKRINQAGGIAFVARSIDDVIEGLNLQDRFLFK
jgi:hypothetical protein